MNTHTKLREYAHAIRLLDAERADLKARLSTYLEFHPVEVPMRITEPRGLWMLLPRLPLRAAAGAFALALTVATPVFAQNSMPGDMLYPVKVHFNEELRATFTSSSQEKIAWQIERVERRIEEARLLAERGRLTGEAEAAIAETIRAHAESAVKELARLQTSDEKAAATARATFESALEVQSVALEAAPPASRPAVSIEKALERSRAMLADIAAELERLVEEGVEAIDEGPAEQAETEGEADTATSTDSEPADDTELETAPDTATTTDEQVDERL